MNIIVRYIVSTIMRYFRRAWNMFKIKQLKKQVKVLKEEVKTVTQEVEDVKKISDDQYLSFKRKYAAYLASRDKLRHVAERLRRDRGSSAKDNSGSGKEDK